ncbi:MAG TPA: polysaccharide deacetylase family protein [Edaphobacter sp.]|jgi:peptidoglycan/xylan/chitin deacetylase (PgdA/CDA1 family)|nr:polysaccharide deacetylase family protein [Edaphobacter sp.]
MHSKKSGFEKILLVISAAVIAMTVSASAQQIAFTWDDLPSHNALPPGETRVEIGRKIIVAMKEAHMPPVYGFVNGIHTEDEPLSTPMLKEWREAGLPLGNHTWSHPNLNQKPLAEWESDTLKNEALLKSYMENEDWRWLRYPNLAEGDTPQKREDARRFLAEHGYKIAGVTMSFGDYLYNGPYARCVAKKDAVSTAQLETSYLAAADATIDYTRSMSKALFGRDIPYVLLMHVGALDARMLPRLLKLYRDKGFTFVSLQDAEKDPFYKNDLDLSLPSVPDTLEEAMRARNLPLPTRPAPTVDLNSICR